MTNITKEFLLGDVKPYDTEREALNKINQLLRERKDVKEIDLQIEILKFLFQTIFANKKFLFHSDIFFNILIDRTYSFEKKWNLAPYYRKLFLHEKKIMEQKIKNPEDEMFEDEIFF